MECDGDWRTDEVTRDLGVRVSRDAGPSEAERLEQVHRAEMTGLMAVALATDLAMPLAAGKREATSIARALDELEGALRLAGVTEAAAGQLARARAALVALGEQADFIQRMTRDVVRFQRRDPGDSGPADVRRAVATAVRYANTGPNVPIAIRVPRDLTAAVGEHTLVRVLMSLIRNAAAAYPSLQRRVGWIVVSAAREGGDLIIEVADDAGSVPEDMRDKLFEPYAGPRGWVGLGMAVGRALLREAGGDLLLAATGPSETRFRVRVKAIQ
jgi:signal transduction histidine kinase